MQSFFTGSALILCILGVSSTQAKLIWPAAAPWYCNSVEQNYSAQEHQIIRSIDKKQDVLPDDFFSATKNQLIESIRFDDNGDIEPQHISNEEWQKELSRIKRMQNIQHGIVKTRFGSDIVRGFIATNCLGIFCLSMYYAWHKGISLFNCFNQENANRIIIPGCLSALVLSGIGLQQYQQYITYLNNQLKKANKENQSLQQALSHTQAVRIACASCDTNKQAFNEKMRMQHIEIEDLKKQCDNLETQLQSAQLSNKELSKQAESLAQLNRKYVNDNEDLQARLQVFNEKEEIVRLSGLVERQKQRYQDMSIWLGKARQEKDILENKKIELEKQLQNYELQNQTLSAHNKELQESLQRLGQNIPLHSSDLNEEFYNISADENITNDTQGQKKPSNELPTDLDIIDPYLD